jgi:CMP-N,N'-diacetyllegionaminic acid synthase
MLKKKIPCIVLARKNSKGIKNKNRIKLNSIYLIEHTISYLKKEKLIDDIIVSTDDEIIANISKKNKCFTIFPRPKKLANDFATSEVALSHALKIYEKQNGQTEITTFVQTTEFFKIRGMIDKCIKVLQNNEKVESCFAAYEQHKNYWVREKFFLKRISPYKDRYKPRQIKAPVLREDSGLGLATRSCLIRKNIRIGEYVKCISYKNPLNSLDLNNLYDLKLIKKIISN